MHTAPATDDLIDEAGDLLVDEVIPLERIDEALPPVLARVAPGAARSVPRVNTGRRERDHRRYYNRRARRLVEELYAEDIRRFGYSF